MLDCVLLVDDNEADNFMHEMVVEDLNCAKQVLTAINGKEALDMVKAYSEENEKGPDLILLDINMPIWNGWEFLKGYKEFLASADASKIVILTTSLNPNDKAYAKQSDLVSGFLNKPLDENALKRILADLFPQT